MKAAEGDQLHFYSRLVDHPDQLAVIVEVRGSDGDPPYRVRFDDGTERLVFPGPDCVVVRRTSTID